MKCSGIKSKLSFLGAHTVLKLMLQSIATNVVYATMIKIISYLTKQCFNALM